MGLIVRIKSATLGLTLGLALVGLTACTAQYRNHGYVPSDEELAAVVVGVDTRDSVAETIGSPSSSGVLDNSGYYYVRSRVKHFGPTRPEVIERQLVAITFSQRGVVQSVERYSLQDGLVVPLSRRVTDNNLTNNSFLQELLKNLGNFDPGSVFSST